MEYFGEDFDPNSRVTTVSNLAGVSASFVPDYLKIIDSLDITLKGSGEIPTLSSCPEINQTDKPISWQIDYNNNPQMYTARFLYHLPDNYELCN